MLANGNVRTADDVEANRSLTGADGVMSAEGLLDDPTLFAKHASTAKTTAGLAPQTTTATLRVTASGTEQHHAQALGAAAAQKCGESTHDDDTAAAADNDLAATKKKRKSVAKKLREANSLAALDRELTDDEASKVTRPSVRCCEFPQLSTRDEFFLFCSFLTRTLVHTHPNFHVHAFAHTH